MHRILVVVFCLAVITPDLSAQGEERMSQNEAIKLVLSNTEPLKWQRGNRVPLYLWPIMDVGTRDDAETESIIRQLDARGIAVISTWNPSRREQTLA